jgi:hypothetical protein
VTLPASFNRYSIEKFVKFFASKATKVERVKFVVKKKRPNEFEGYQSVALNQHKN